MLGLWLLLCMLLIPLLKNGHLVVAIDSVVFRVLLHHEVELTAYLRTLSISEHVILAEGLHLQIVGI